MHGQRLIYALCWWAARGQKEAPGEGPNRRNAHATPEVAAPEPHWGRNADIRANLPFLHRRGPAKKKQGPAAAGGPRRGAGAEGARRRTWRAWTSATRTACDARPRAKKAPARGPRHARPRARKAPLKGPGRRPFTDPGRSARRPGQRAWEGAPPREAAREGARRSRRSTRSAGEKMRARKKTRQGRRRGATGSAPASARPRASRARGRRLVRRREQPGALLRRRRLLRGDVQPRRLLHVRHRG